MFYNGFFNLGLLVLLQNKYRSLLCWLDILIAVIIQGFIMLTVVYFFKRKTMVKYSQIGVDKTIKY